MSDASPTAPHPSHSRPPDPASRARRWIYVGCTAAIAGICMSLTPARDIAGTVTAVGFICAIVGLHRFGRTGPDLAARRATSD